MPSRSHSSRPIDAAPILQINGAHFQMVEASSSPSSSSSTRRLFPSSPTKSVPPLNLRRPPSRTMSNYQTHFALDEQMSPIREASAASVYQRSPARPSQQSSPTNSIRDARRSSDSHASQITLVNPRPAPSPPPAFSESPPPSYSALIRLNDLPASPRVIRKSKSGKFAAICGAFKVAEADMASFDDLIHPKLPKKMKVEVVQVAVEVVKEEWATKDSAKKSGSVRRRSMFSMGRKRAETTTSKPVGLAI